MEEKYHIPMVIDKEVVKELRNEGDQKVLGAAIMRQVYNAIKENDVDSAISLDIKISW